MILVDGELQTRSYEDKNGVTQNIVELVVDNAHFTGETKNSGKNNNLPPPYSAPAAAVVESSNEDFLEAATDDDYPF